jgi:Tol biopolymer transport system component
MPATGSTYGIAWIPDGRIVYASDQSGGVEIWMMNADGSESRQVTGDKIFKFAPTVSPDGKHIVYTTSQNGGQLVRIDSGGGNPVMLTKYNNSVNPHISPDGKWVIHHAYVDGRTRIVRVPLEGGETQILSESFEALNPRYSNDGTKFACFLIDGSLAIVPADGGDPLKTIKIPPGADRESGMIWTPDDRGVVFAVQAGESRNLWIQPIDGGEAKQITNLENPSVINAKYSRDGKRIALVRGDFVSNAIMITDFR